MTKKVRVSARLGGSIFAPNNLSVFLLILVTVGIALISQPAALAQWTDDSSTNTPIDRSLSTIGVDIIGNGAGGAIMTWHERVVLGAQFDIFARGVNSIGVPWADSVVICSATDDQWFPVAAPDGAGGAIIAWEDHRSGNSDIYAQRVNAAGVVQWTADGIPICVAADSQYFARIISDGAGGAIITWVDQRSDSGDVYAQRVDSTGVVQWAPNGVPVCTAAGYQIFRARIDDRCPALVITGDGSHGAILTWEDHRSGTNYDIYAQRINGSGARQWIVGADSNGVPICIQDSDQVYVGIMSDGSGGAIIGWADRRPSVNTKLYAQRINASGAVQWAPNGVDVWGTDVVIFRLPFFTSDNAGGAYIAYAYDEMRLQHIGPTGAIQWPAGGINIMSTSGGSNLPIALGDGAGGVIVAWEYDDPVVFHPRQIHAQRVNAAGVSLWKKTGVVITAPTGTPGYVRIVSDEQKGAIIAWSYAPPNQYMNVLAQRVLSNGLLPTPGTISGTKFNDRASNGIRDFNDSGVVNWKIRLKDAGNVIIDSTLTDSSGAYAFKHLENGTYTVAEAQQDNWLQTFPAGGANYPVTVADTGIYPGKDFGNFLSGTISGQKFQDLNGNGLKDGAEVGLANWRIRLSKNGTPIDSILTDGSGNYSFANLLVGAYTLSEKSQAGWNRTLPAGAGTYSITIDTGGGTHIVGRNFGNYLISTISGQQFNDFNGNGVKDPGDSTLANWRIRLSKNGTQIDSVLTDGSGTYTFTNLPTGSYTISEQLQASWTQTHPSPPGTYTVAIDTGGTNLTGKDFGSVQLGSISGKKYDDVANDSAMTGDPTLNGCVVKLYKSGILQSRILTSDGGNYSFSNLFAGTYTVEESLQVGWKQTYPRIGSPGVVPTTFGANAGPRAYAFVILSGANGTGMDFGNFQPAVVHISKHRDRDGDFNTSADRIDKTWGLSLYRGSVSPGNLIASDSSSTSLGVGDLVPGTYIAAEHDSTGWTSMGKVINGLAKAGQSAADTFTLTQGQVRTIDFVNELLDTTSSQIRAHWNLLSLSVGPPDRRKPVLFPGAASPAFGYSGTYTVAETLKPGIGYWLYFGGGQSAEITGAVLEQDTIDVAEGWNLIGSIGTPVPTSSVASIPGGIVTSRFFAYQGSYLTVDTIKPGWAYWVRVNQDGKLILSSSGLMAGDRIEIRRGSELPPSPPDANSGNGGNAGKEVPKEFALDQNYPNPFNPLTVIRYQLPVESRVTVTVSNSLGQVVATLVDQIQDAGYTSIKWNADHFPSGVYFYRIHAVSTIDVGRSFTDARKLLLLK